MKTAKTTLLLLVGLTLTFTVGVVTYSKMATISPLESVVFGAVALIALFSIIIAIKRLKDEKKGLTTEDELSRKIRIKAAANSFITSFYLWTVIILFATDSGLSGEVQLGIGITGMGLIFIGFWLYHNNRGID